MYHYVNLPFGSQFSCDDKWWLYHSWQVRSRGSWWAVETSSVDTPVFSVSGLPCFVVSSEGVQTSCLPAHPPGESQVFVPVSNTFLPRSVLLGVRVDWKLMIFFEEYLKQDWDLRPAPSAVMWLETVNNFRF